MNAFQYLRHKPTGLFVFVFHWLSHRCFFQIGLKSRAQALQFHSQNVFLLQSSWTWFSCPWLHELGWAYHPFSNAGSKALCSVAHATWLKDMRNHPKSIQVWFHNVCEYITYNQMIRIIHCETIPSGRTWTMICGVTHPMKFQGCSAIQEMMVTQPTNSKSKQLFFVTSRWYHVAPNMPSLAHGCTPTRFWIT